MSRGTQIVDAMPEERRVREGGHDQRKNDWCGQVGGARAKNRCAAAGVCGETDPREEQTPRARLTGKRGKSGQMNGWCAMGTYLETRRTAPARVVLWARHGIGVRDTLATGRFVRRL